MYVSVYISTPPGNPETRRMDRSYTLPSVFSLKQLAATMHSFVPVGSVFPGPGKHPTMSQGQLAKACHEQMESIMMCHEQMPGMEGSWEPQRPSLAENLGLVQVLTGQSTASAVPMQVDRVLLPVPAKLEPFASVAVDRVLLPVLVKLEPFTSVPVKLEPFASVAVKLEPFASVPVKLEPFASVPVTLEPFAPVAAPAPVELEAIALGPAPEPVQLEPFDDMAPSRVIKYEAGMRAFIANHPVRENDELLYIQEHERPMPTLYMPISAAVKARRADYIGVITALDAWCKLHVNAWKLVPDPEVVLLSDLIWAAAVRNMDHFTLVGQCPGSEQRRGAYDLWKIQQLPEDQRVAAAVSGSVTYDMWKKDASSAADRHAMCLYACACYLIAWKVEISSLRKTPQMIDLCRCVRRYVEETWGPQTRSMSKCVQRGDVAANVGYDGLVLEQRAMVRELEFMERVVFKELSWDVTRFNPVNVIDAWMKEMCDDPCSMKLRAIAVDVSRHFTQSTQQAFDPQNTALVVGMGSLGEAWVRVGEPEMQSVCKKMRVV
jgi:hypothetical protein